MNQADRIALLLELIAVDTTSGRTEAQRHLQGHVAAELTQRERRLNVTTAPPNEYPWTLITTRSNGPNLVFACHVDTVPVGDESQWTNPPFSPIAVDGNVHGRGAVDMKGGLVAAAIALLEAAALGRAVALLLTSDEEIGSLGASDASRSLQDLDVGAVIIPEATENQVITGHRGALWIEATAAGRAAHGSAPGLGENAALKLMATLGRATTGLPIQIDGFLGAETWNLGIIQAGTAPNIVPDAASAIIDMRTIDAGGQLLAWWQSQPELESVDVVLRLPALRTDRSGEWVRSLPAPVADTPATYFTDGSVLSQMLPGIPIVVWGPGSPSQMHSLNEHISVTSLETATANFRQTVRAWL
ncbi:M20 family metallopeptidase [Luethyella okanaganae]|uniref:M20 family metallopeptidase n=1 Tax=Luethyella okanaganae TaxID=69372 RepID=A0ABW1VIW6_9MICO